MKINAYPIVRKNSYITVKCADNVNRIVEWDVWSAPRKEVKEVEKEVRAGNCVELLYFGCTRLERWVCEPLIIDMFDTIAISLGKLCLSDEAFAAEVLAKATALAVELDDSWYPQNQEWIAGAKASIRNYKRYKNERGIAKKYAEIILYFRLFDVLDIDLCLEPRKSKKTAYRITTINGHSLDFVVDYRALSESQAAELSECLLNGNNPEWVSEELQEAAYNTYREFFYYGIINELCSKQSRYLIQPNYNTPFTRSLVATALSRELCTQETADAILAAAKETDVTEYVPDGKIRDLLFDFLYNAHPYTITEA